MAAGLCRGLQLLHGGADSVITLDRRRPLPLAPGRLLELKAQSGLTALHIAVAMGQAAAVHVLLGNGASLYCQLRTHHVYQHGRVRLALGVGDTAMHTAAVIGREDVLRMLLRAHVSEAAWLGRAVQGVRWAAFASSTAASAGAVADHGSSLSPALLVQVLAAATPCQVTSTPHCVLLHGMPLDPRTIRNARGRLPYHTALAWDFDNLKQLLDPSMHPR